MTASRTIPFIVATIFIDAVGFGIIMPVLPQLVMEVGRIDLPHAIEVGAWIGLVMAVATFLASPVLGNLSDRFGRRRVLLLSLAGLTIDYALLTIVGAPRRFPRRPCRSPPHNACWRRTTPVWRKTSRQRQA